MFSLSLRPFLRELVKTRYKHLFETFPQIPQNLPPNEGPAGSLLRCPLDVDEGVEGYEYEDFQHPQPGTSPANRASVWSENEREKLEMLTLELSELYQKQPLITLQHWLGLYIRITLITLIALIAHEYLYSFL